MRCNNDEDQICSEMRIMKIKFAMLMKINFVQHEHLSACQHGLQREVPLQTVSIIIIITTINIFTIITMIIMITIITIFTIIAIIVDGVAFFSCSVKHLNDGNVGKDGSNWWSSAFCNSAHDNVAKMMNCCPQSPAELHCLPPPNSIFMQILTLANHFISTIFRLIKVNKMHKSPKVKPSIGRITGAARSFHVYPLLRQ